MSIQYSKTDIHGFLPGKQLRISATMPSKGYFQVLLYADTAEVFHFSVNVDPPNVIYEGNPRIRNWSHCWHLGRRRNWNWTEDTIATGNEVPIKINQKFTLILRAVNNGIEIIIDGKPIFTASGWKEHELKNIKQMKIKETIKVHEVDEEDIGGGKMIENPPVPAKLDFSRFGLPRGFGPGKRIRIVGVPTAPKRFAIDLVEEDPSNKYTDNIEQYSHHMHFNARFDQKQVIRNNLIKGKGWQSPEEHDGGFPFAVNKQFTADFLGLPGNKVKVFIDEKPFCEFGPRGDLSSVDRLEVIGDVQLKSVQMTGAGDGGGGGYMSQETIITTMGPGGGMFMSSGGGPGGMSMQYMS